jgi:hypothetical protein
MNEVIKHQIGTNLGRSLSIEIVEILVGSESSRQNSRKAIRNCVKLAHFQRAASSSATRMSNFSEKPWNLYRTIFGKEPDTSSVTSTEWLIEQGTNRRCLGPRSLSVSSITLKT